MLEARHISDLSRGRLERRCEMLAQPVYLGDHTGLCRVLGRYKMFLDTRDHGFACHVLLDGFWEIWLTQFIARYVKPGMRVADIGANYGYYSLLLGDLIGPQGALHCVEPNPAAAAMLRMSLAQNGFSERTTVHELALGADDGEASLCVPRGEPKNAHVLPSGHISDMGPLHKISVRSFDALLAGEPGLDFVKIDVEGSEEGIIAGMETLIRKFHPAMVLEFNVGRYRDPASFLSKLGTLYSNIRYVDYDGNAAPIDSDALLTTHVNEDWLLFLSQD